MVFSGLMAFKKLLLWNQHVIKINNIFLSQKCYLKPEIDSPLKLREFRYYFVFVESYYLTSNTAIKKMYLSTKN